MISFQTKLSVFAMLWIISICSQYVRGAPTYNTTTRDRRLTIDQLIERAGKMNKTRSCTMLGSRMSSGHGVNDSILVDGDMMLTRKQWEHMTTNRNDRRRYKRAVINSEDSGLLWTDKYIPYTLKPGAYTSEQVQLIEEATDHWSKYTCLRFGRRNGEKDYIYIAPLKGCYSYVGMMSHIRQQKISLVSGCFEKYIIIHEFGHAIGLYHEQSRSDRDEYITINRDNIDPKYIHNFLKIKDWQGATSLNTPYDYTSIMHYGPYTFATNSNIPSIFTKDPEYQGVIGKAEILSFRDVKVVALLYKCNDHCSSKTCQGEGFVGKDCKCWCPDPKGLVPAVYCESGRPVGDDIPEPATPSPTSPTSPLECRQRNDPQGRFYRGTKATVSQSKCVPWSHSWLKYSSEQVINYGLEENYCRHIHNVSKPSCWIKISSEELVLLRCNVPFCNQPATPSPTSPTSPLECRRRNDPQGRFYRGTKATVSQSKCLSWSHIWLKYSSEQAINYGLEENYCRYIHNVSEPSCWIIISRDGEYYLTLRHCNVPFCNREL